MLTGISSQRQSFPCSSFGMSPSSFLVLCKEKPTDDLDQSPNLISLLFSPFSSRIRNVMLASDGTTPILMDLGSCIPARIAIKTRNQALVQQDLAAEHSSMPYRAPELFDVRTNQTLTEACDVWSLGALLFALAYSHSPFEPSPHLYPNNYLTTGGAGGSIAMAVASASYKHPPTSPYGDGFKALIDGCLVVDVGKRLKIEEVVRRCEELIRDVER
jgi:serine/threonine kinase 16